MILKIKISIWFNLQNLFLAIKIFNDFTPKLDYPLFANVFWLKLAHIKFMQVF